MLKKTANSFLIVVGFILSPLSWWNDLLVNIPLSYIFALPFTLVNKALFLPVFIINYWLTNIAGMLLMHFGISGLANKKASLTRKELYTNIAFALFYTLIIAALFKIGFITLPSTVTADN